MLEGVAASTSGASFKHGRLIGHVPLHHTGGEGTPASVLLGMCRCTTQGGRVHLPLCYPSMHVCGCTWAHPCMLSLPPRSC